MRPSGETSNFTRTVLQCAAPERAPDRRLNAADRPRAARSSNGGFSRCGRGTWRCTRRRRIVVFKRRGRTRLCCRLHFPLRLFNLFSGLGLGLGLGFGLGSGLWITTGASFGGSGATSGSGSGSGSTTGSTTGCAAGGAQDRPAPPL